jgi:hypothetical protein
MEYDTKSLKEVTKKYKDRTGPIVEVDIRIGGTRRFMSRIDQWVTHMYTTNHVDCVVAEHAAVAGRFDDEAEGKKGQRRKQLRRWSGHQVPGSTRMH